MRNALLLVALVFTVGCADGMTLSMDAPDPGSVHDGAPDTGGDAGRVCDAALETLSGTAIYVTGTASAADPNASTGLSGTPTCYDWVKAYAMQISTMVSVIDGKIGTDLVQQVTSYDTADGCVYRLRRFIEALPNSTQRPCALSIDYSLLVR